MLDFVLFLKRFSTIYIYIYINRRNQETNTFPQHYTHSLLYLLSKRYFIILLYHSIVRFVNIQNHIGYIFWFLLYSNNVKNKVLMSDQNNVHEHHRFCKRTLFSTKSIQGKFDFASLPLITWQEWFLMSVLAYYVMKVTDFTHSYSRIITADF